MSDVDDDMTMQITTKWIFAKYPPLGGIDLSWRLSWAKGGILFY